MAKQPSSIKIDTRSIIRDYINNLRREIDIDKVILFGSRARGEDLPNSDIDLIIISSDFEGVGFFDRLVLLNRARRGMKRSAPMDIFGYTPGEFNRLAQDSMMLQEARREGLVVE